MKVYLEHDRIDLVLLELLDQLLLIITDFLLIDLADQDGFLFDHFF